MFGPEQMKRDEMGFWAHSVFDGATEEVDITKLPISRGMEFRFIEFFSDAPEKLVERYESGSDVLAVREWEPTVPSGVGWFICGIYDTEDGPYACFARQRQAEEIAEVKKR